MARKAKNFDNELITIYGKKVFLAEDPRTGEIMLAKNEKGNFVYVVLVEENRARTFANKKSAQEFISKKLNDFVYLTPPSWGEQYYSDDLELIFMAMGDLLFTWAKEAVDKEDDLAVEAMDEEDELDVEAMDEEDDLAVEAMSEEEAREIRILEKYYMLRDQVLLVPRFEAEKIAKELKR